MPPSAASTGMASRRRSRSSPRSSSRLASRPTTRKKNVIRPWSTQAAEVGGERLVAEREREPRSSRPTRRRMPGDVGPEPAPRRWRRPAPRRHLPRPRGSRGRATRGCVPTPCARWRWSFDRTGSRRREHRSWLRRVGRSSENQHSGGAGMKLRGLIIGALAALAAASVAVFGGTASAAQSQQPPRSPVAEGNGGGAATMSPYATSAAIERAASTAATRSTPRSPRPPRSASPSRSSPGPAAAASSSTAARATARSSRSTAARGAGRREAGHVPRRQRQARATSRRPSRAARASASRARWRRGATRSTASAAQPVDGLPPGRADRPQGLPARPGVAKAIRPTRRSSRTSRRGEALPARRPGAPGRLRLRNPELARTYQQIAQHGWRWFYNGPIAKEIAATVQHPPTPPAPPPVEGGTMTAQDMADYTAPFRRPRHVGYRGYDV